MAPHTIAPAVGAVCHCKVKAGLRQAPRGLHTRTRLSSLLKMNLDSSLKTIWFHFVAVKSRHAGLYYKQRYRWVSLAAHIMGATIPDILQLGALRWFRKKQRPLVKVLPVSEQRPMRQLALHERLVLCDGFLDD
ncbi:e3 ubiquitin-protein ligase RNF13 [Trichonephila clavipes]|nr:e3 ubiquitin-protein ligase RNF13 [Trichonephila clavipes]